LETKDLLFPLEIQFISNHLKIENPKNLESEKKDD